MNSLYAMISSYENAELLTVITLGLICLSWISFIWGNANRLNVRLNLFQWSQIYVLGTLLFLSAVIVLGKFIVPENVDKLLNLLHADGLLRSATLKYQQLLLAIIKPML